MMDMDWYKNNVRNYDDTFLDEQIVVVRDTRELCWDNAEDSYGEERERWYDEYNECNEQLKILEQEKESRSK